MKNEVAASFIFSRLVSAVVFVESLFDSTRFSLKTLKMESDPLSTSSWLTHSAVVAELDDEEKDRA